MKKFLAIILILGLVFWAGYYVGQQPPEDIKKQLRELSQEVVEQTIGLGEEELLVQKELLRAKSEFLNGKANIMDGQSIEAIVKLQETLEHLEQAARLQGGTASEAFHEAISNIEDLQRSLNDGLPVPQEAWEQAQEKLDAL